MTIDVTLTLALFTGLFLLAAVCIHARRSLAHVRSRLGRAVALAGASALTFAIVVYEVASRTPIGG